MHENERRKNMPNVDPEKQAEIVEKAIQNWMDAKFAKFGKWTLSALAVAVFGLVCKYLFTHGWTPL